MSIRILARYIAKLPANGFIPSLPSRHFLRMREKWKEWLLPASASRPEIIRLPLLPRWCGKRHLKPFYPAWKLDLTVFPGPISS